MAVLRTLQMCKSNDLNELQMPENCPWCGAPITVSGSSLYMQIWNYASHMTTAKACVHTYTGILKDSEVKEQTLPKTRKLLSARDKERARNFRSGAGLSKLQREFSNNKIPTTESEKEQVEPEKQEEVKMRLININHTTMEAKVAKDGQSQNLPLLPGPNGVAIVKLGKDIIATLVQNKSLPSDRLLVEENVMEKTLRSWSCGQKKIFLPKGQNHMQKKNLARMREMKHGI